MMKLLKFFTNDKNRKVTILIAFVVIAVCSLPNMGIGCNYNHANLFYSGSIFNAGYSLINGAQRPLALALNSTNLAKTTFTWMSIKDRGVLWQSIIYGIIGIILVVPVILSLISLKSKKSKNSRNYVSIAFCLLYFGLVIYGANNFASDVKRSVSLAGGHSSGVHISFLPTFYVSVIALVIVVVATIIGAKGMIFEDTSTSTKVEVIGKSVDAVDEIEKFKKLLDEGTITQEEFDAKKKQILGL